MKNKYKILIILFPIIAFITYANWPKTHISYFTTGPIQGLANENEIWLFCEFPRMVLHPGIGCDAPTAYPEGNFQEILVIDESGIKRRILVSIENGISFHPNSSEIYIGTDGIYLYKQPSLYFKRSIFKFENDHFRLLSYEASEDIFNKMGMKADNHESFLISLDAFQKITVKNGWKKLPKETNFLPINYEWNNLNVLIDETASIDNDFELTINIKGKNTNLPIVLKYDRGFKKYKGKRKHVSQHGHKK